MLFLSINLILFYVTSAQRCGDRRMGYSGEISSPRFPSNYPNGQNCTWHVTGPSDANSILIEFKVFDINEFKTGSKCDDFLKILDGNNHIIINRCGRYPGFKRLIFGNSFTVFFCSDIVRPGPGFYFTWRVYSHITKTTRNMKNQSVHKTTGALTSKQVTSSSKGRVSLRLPVTRSTSVGRAKEQTETAIVPSTQGPPRTIISSTKRPSGIAVSSTQQPVTKGVLPSTKRPTKNVTMIRVSTTKIPNIATVFSTEQPAKALVSSTERKAQTVSYARRSENTTTSSTERKRKALFSTMTTSAVSHYPASNIQRTALENFETEPYLLTMTAWSILGSTRGMDMKDKPINTYNEVIVSADQKQYGTISTNVPPKTPTRKNGWRKLNGPSDYQKTTEKGLSDIAGVSGLVTQMSKTLIVDIDCAGSGECFAGTTSTRKKDISTSRFLIQDVSKRLPVSAVTPEMTYLFSKQLSGSENEDLWKTTTTDYTTSSLVDTQDNQDTTHVTIHKNSDVFNHLVKLPAGLLICGAIVLGLLLLSNIVTCFYLKTKMMKERSAKYSTLVHQHKISHVPTNYDCLKKYEELTTPPTPSKYWAIGAKEYVKQTTPNTYSEYLMAAVQENEELTTPNTISGYWGIAAEENEELTTPNTMSGYWGLAFQENEELATPITPAVYLGIGAHKDEDGQYQRLHRQNVFPVPSSFSQIGNHENPPLFQCFELQSVQLQQVADCQFASTSENPPERHNTETENLYCDIVC